MQCPSVPVSWGELLDKISILEIKHARIADAAARTNVARELLLLAALAAPVADLPGLAALRARLGRVNAALWEIEDALRAQEAEAEFGTSFVALARSVYVTNDERAAIKRQINRLLESDLVEEKSYGRTRPAGDLIVQPAH